MRNSMPNPPAQCTREDLEADASGFSALREIDLRKLLDAVVSEQHGDPVALDLYHDISAEASHRWFLCSQGSGYVPCLLASHKLFSTRRGGVLTGMDHMLLHHFPLACNYSMNNDAELRHLAGMAMHIPQAGAKIAMLLVVTEWGGVPVDPAVAMQCALDFTNMPAVVPVKPLGAPPVEVRTWHLPGLPLKRKVDTEGSGSEVPGVGAGAKRVARSRDFTFDAISPTPTGKKEARHAVSVKPLAKWHTQCAQWLEDPDVNAVDLTPVVTHAWVERLLLLTQQAPAPLLRLGPFSPLFASSIRPPSSVPSSLPPHSHSLLHPSSLPPSSLLPLPSLLSLLPQPSSLFHPSSSIPPLFSVTPPPPSSLPCIPTPVDVNPSLQCSCVNLSRNLHGDTASRQLLHRTRAAITATRANCACFKQAHPTSLRLQA